MGSQSEEPWKKAGFDTKEEWEKDLRSRALKAQQVWREKEKKRRQERSEAENRRRDRLRAQQEKAHEVYGEELPFVEYGDYPAWTGRLLIPDRVDNARGFDVEELRSMIEPKRAEGQAMLGRGLKGEEALIRKKEREQERLQKLWEQFGENEERSEQITDSERLLAAVNSIAGSSVEGGEQAEQELAEISREQRHILGRVQDLRVSIFVFQNLLYRKEQSLSNSAEAWEVLYEPFELEEEGDERE